MLETLQSKAPVGLGLLDRECRVVRVNEVLASINGMSVESCIGRTMSSLFPALWPTMEPLYRQILDTGVPVCDVELEPPSAQEDGAVGHRWLTSYYPLVLDVEIVGIGVVVVDATERMATESARRELAAIVEGSADAIFGVTVDGVVSSWNDAAERLFGYCAEEIIGQPVRLIAPPDQEAEQEEIRAQLLAGGRHVRTETVRRRKDGSLVDVFVTASTTTDESGAIVGLSVISHDITARRKEQRALDDVRRRLAEAQRIAHVGSFEYDVVTDELMWSEEYFRILGVDPAVTPTIGVVRLDAPPRRPAGGGPGVVSGDRARYDVRPPAPTHRPRGTAARADPGRPRRRSRRPGHDRGRHDDRRDRARRHRTGPTGGRERASRSASNRPGSVPPSSTSTGSRPG